MDKISDFFGELKNRFSSPLFSSFIISWIIINWKVPVVLFFYSEKQIQADGYISYNDYILNVVTGKKALLYPFIFALLYTLLYPFIKEGIKNIGVFAERLGTNLSRSISKKAYIPMERYLSMQNNIDQKEKELETLISVESKLTEENQGMSRLITSKDEQIESITKRLSAADKTNESNAKLISQYEEQIRRLNALKNPNYIQGLWKIQQFNYPTYYAFIYGDKGFFYQVAPTKEYEEFQIVTFSRGQVNNQPVISFLIASLQGTAILNNFNSFYAFLIGSYSDDHTPPEMVTEKPTPWSMNEILEPEVKWVRENESPNEIAYMISRFKDKYRLQND